MSDYNKITNFTIKDSLPSGNTNKIIKGTELDNEFNAIQSAVSSKADANSPAFGGTPTAPTAASGTNNTQIATTAFVATAAAAAAAGVLVDNSVTTSKIADAAVTAAKIDNGAVTAAKIDNGAVTAAKIASGVSGTGPVFRATKSGNQSISNATATKITFETEESDTNNCYTGSRFTPNVAGYYQVNAGLMWTANTTSGGTWPVAYGTVILYKNGTVASLGNMTTTNGGTSVSQVSDIIYCNGSTDYIEVYGRQASGGNLAVLAVHATLGAPTSFSAALVRNA